jgi:hypothetical protein
MELLDGVPGWVIGVAVAVIFVGTLVGILFADFRKKKNGENDS